MAFGRGPERRPHYATQFTTDTSLVVLELDDTHTGGDILLMLVYHVSLQ